MGNETVEVWHLNGAQTFEVVTSTTIQELRDRITTPNAPRVHLYYKWSLIAESQNGKKISQIIALEERRFPRKESKDQKYILAIDDDIHKELNLSQELCATSQLQNPSSRQLKLYRNLSRPKQQNQVEPNYSKGHNGHILFEGRESALVASSVEHASRNTELKKSQIELIKSHNPDRERNDSLIGGVLQVLGLAHNSPPEKQHKIHSVVKEAIKVNDKFSDFDPKFAYYLEEIYIKFMLESLGRIHYINYQNIDDFDIQKPIPKNAKVAIIGDYGTGLRDSLQLLQNLVQKQGVDVILHLGDVYYAGTPAEYEKSITKPLQALRVKTQRNIRFYSIPGNHDYYSWGLPFLCFVKGINKDKFEKQSASYFCLRSEDSKWQFLGIDTAYHDSNPLNQLSPLYVGPHIRHRELQWHKHRLDRFPGSTVLLTHHQLFSIHERITACMTKYREFSCLNPMLSAQLFEYLPTVSGWYWGHEHSFMLFKEGNFGLPKGRLLGNSSFHVIQQKEHPYKRRQGFPYIPFVCEDGQYLKKYTPKNPNNPSNEQYFGLCYAVMDLGKMEEDDSLPIQYWCNPCFSDSVYEKMDKMSPAQKSQYWFEEYRIYEETLPSKKRLLSEQKTISNGDEVYLRCEIGLLLALDLNRPILNLEGSKVQVVEPQVRQKYTTAYLTVGMYLGKVTKRMYLSFSEKQDSLILSQSKGPQSQWNFYSIPKDYPNQESLKANKAMRIENNSNGKFLSWIIDFEGKCSLTLEDPEVKAQNHQHEIQNSAATKSSERVPQMVEPQNSKKASNESMKSIDLPWTDRSNEHLCMWRFQKSSFVQESKKVSSEIQPE